MDLIESVKQIFRGSKKQRQDSVFDQYSRVIMVQVCMVSAVAMGMSWFSDKLNCIVPDTHSLSPGFVAEACWINGFYVFREIQNIPNELGYYGIPNDVKENGIYLASGKQCAVMDTDADCKPMEKTFFLQFQWYTFFMAALAIFYYAPYICYKLANHDIISLQKAAMNKDDEGITRYFFDHKMNTPRNMNVRVLVNVLVRVMYVVAYGISFFLINKSLYGNFTSYGKRWIDWTMLTNEDMYDYMTDRTVTKPGEVMLPSFGLCEVREGGMDQRHSIANKHVFVCEYSPHILYHYVLILVFFLMAIGIGMSLLGLIMLVLRYWKSVKVISGKVGIKKRLTLREYEYLDMLDQYFPVLRQRIIQRLAHPEPEVSRNLQPEAADQPDTPLSEDLRWRQNAQAQPQRKQDV